MDQTGLPVTLSWGQGGLPATGELRWLDAATGGSLIQVDLRAQDSLQLTTAGLTLLRLRYTPVPQVSHSYDLPARWSLVSLPCDASDPSLSAVLPTAISLFRYAEGYQAALSLAPGVGYWVSLPAPAQTRVSGSPFADASLLLSLPSRWSMVGPGATRLDVATLKAAFPGIVSVYGYANGYQFAATMEPGKAYWINLSTATQLDLSGQVAPAIKPVVAAGPVSGGSLLWAEGSGGSQALTLGVSRQEVIELPPVPPAGLFDVRVELEQGIGAWQAPAGEGSWRVRLQGGVQCLRWQVPAQSAWDLEVDGTTVALVGSGAVSVDENATVLLHDRSGTPRATVLHGAWPNPFNPSTAINYQLAQPGDIRLRVYASSGQLVRQLVSTHQAAGMHQVVWDGRDSAGISVGTGVYLCELQASGYRAVRRMVLLE